MRLILASASPRRKELLSQIGVTFDVCAVDIDETPFVNEPPSAYVSRMATEKAQRCFALQKPTDSLVVLGADTTVIIDNDILGKPIDYQDCKNMLLQLSGKVHQVMTSVCILINRPEDSGSSPDIFCKVVTTEVCFKVISDKQVETYWQSGEPQDKAGSYGIQGFGAAFVERIQGSYSAVVGLPLAEVADMLGIAGVPIWQTKRLFGKQKNNSEQ